MTPYYRISTTWRRDRNTPELVVLVIDTLLMRCRPVGQTVEQFFIDELFKRAGLPGYRKLRGEYIPTKPC